MSKVLVLIKKDICLILSKKFIILLISPLILYSLYVNLVYIKQDIKPNKVLVYDPEKTIKDRHKDLVFIDSKEELESNLKKDLDSIGIEIGENVNYITYHTTGSSSKDERIERYAGALLSNNLKTNIVNIGSFTRIDKLKRELTSEILFFEIVAIIFMGATSILFHERNMGVIKIYGILPSKLKIFILSKLIIFFVINMLITILLVVFNIGIDDLLNILKYASVHIAIISSATILISHICAFAFKNFKQFGLAYAFIMITMTSPVFLVANTGIQWSWMKYHPIFILYMAIKSSFFNAMVSSKMYYLFSLIGVTTLLGLSQKIMKRNLAEG